MQDGHDLSLVLDSRVPLVLVETPDEQRFLDFLKNVVVGGTASDYRPLFRWSVTDGLQRLDIDLEPQPTNAEPDQVLRHIRAVREPGIYVLLDFHPYLQDAVLVRLLKDIAQAAEERRQTIVLVSHELDLPEELRHVAARFKMELPTEQERKSIIANVVADWNVQHAGDVAVDEHALNLLTQNLAGLTRADTERLARKAIYDDGANYKLGCAGSCSREIRTAESAWRVDVRIRNYAFF